MQRWAVTSKERPGDRGRRRGERLRDDLLREAREGRIARNLSQLSVGRAVGLSDSQISLIERGGHPEVPFVLVAQLLGAVGLELSARAYPAGGGIRDAAQVGLLDRLRVRISRRFTWRTEVALPIQGDLPRMGRSARGTHFDDRCRCRNAVAGHPSGRPAGHVEAPRLWNFDRAIILVAATRSNRQLLREFGSSLQANYPITSAAALLALASGDDPGGNSLIVP